MRGSAASVTLGWTGYVASLRATVMHIEFLSCNLLGNVRLEGREGYLRTILKWIFMEKSFVEKIAEIAGYVARIELAMSQGLSWLCCKDDGRMELVKL